MGYESYKLRKHEYLIGCSIEEGAFSTEQKVTFPCYDLNGILKVSTIVCHPNHVDEEQGLCRVDLLRMDDDKIMFIAILMSVSRPPIKRGYSD